MAWVKIDDQFADHPKAAEAGPLGIAMQVAALCYCNRHLTDGFISNAVAARLLDFTGIARIPDGIHAESNDVHTESAQVHTRYSEESAPIWRSVCTDLVRAGMWEPADGGWIIHDYLEYNPARQDVLARRAADLARKRKDEQPAKHSTRIPNGIHAESQRPVPVPVPVPNTSTNESSAISVSGAEQAQTRQPTKERATRATPAPETFPITDEMQNWADEHCPDVDLIAETQRFLDRARAMGTTYKDWRAAWRNWMTSPYAKNRHTPARAAPFGNGFVSNEQAKFERSIEGLRHIGERR